LPPRIRLRSMVLFTLKQWTPVYRVARKLRFAWGSLLGPRSIDGIPGRVHRNDTMLSPTDQYAAQHYNRVGTTVVQILEESIEICNRQWNGLDKVLEVGCNYGRIVRQLVTKIDPSRVYGCDILEEGINFCAKEFNINALPPTFDEGFPKVPTFDLVYLLSVFTHMSDSAVTLLLQDIDKSMNPGAVLVFSANGPISASKVEKYGSPWIDRKDKIRKAMDERGSYFEEYSYGANRLGMSWHTKDRIHDIVSSTCRDLQLRKYAPARIDNHQDIYVFQKTSPPST
ncbi:MAG: class I SAM-dependent methyltransferase, partial [Woeseiaceae bacterium]